MTTPSNTEVYFLKDRRYTSDGLQRSYRVKKLGNHCWMTQNLALTLSMELSHTYSNVEEGETYTTPRVNGKNTSWGDNLEGIYVDVHVDNSRDNYETNIGSLYTFQVATVGTGSNVNSIYYNTVYDICPDGWHLPSWNRRENGSTNRSGSEFSNLTGIVGTQNWGSDGGESHVAAGSGYLDYLDYGFINHASGTSLSATANNTRGTWWSSTVESSSGAYDLYYNRDGSAYCHSRGRTVATPVRCVVK